MPSIISSGIGSGLDISGIVQQLVAAEAAPVELRLGRQEARAQSKLSAFGNLKSALSDFRDKLKFMSVTDKLQSRKVSFGNENLLTPTLSGAAVPASYSVEVAQLAQAQKLTSGAFTDADTAVGNGTLTIAVGSDSFDIEVTTDNNTLGGIRDSINDALDNAGVAATIVNADAGSYLILSGDKTGASNNLVIAQTGGDGGLSALVYDPDNGLTALSESIAAQDALVRIDGLEIYSETNMISGAIDGITLDLQQADPGNTAQLLVQNDVADVRQTIDDFVDSHNALVDTFDQLTSYDAEARLAGALLGDSTLRGIREQIRREFSTAVEDIEAPFSTLAEVGVEIQLDGKLTVDAETLSATLAGDFSKFDQIFTATDGYAVRLFSLVEGFLGSDSIIEARTKGLNDRIDGFAERHIALGERLVSLETRLLNQFNALDSLLSQLSSTSTFLSQQLSNLPGYSGRASG